MHRVLRISRHRGNQTLSDQSAVGLILRRANERELVSDMQHIFDRLKISGQSYPNFPAVCVMISNVVAMFQLCDPIDLSEIAHLGERTRCVKLKVADTRVLVWSSGKCQIMGADSEIQAREVAEQTVQLFIDNNLDCALSDYRVLTVSGYFSMDRRIDIVRLVKTLTASYEPEINNSAVVSFQDCKALVFPSGKVILSGAVSEMACIDVMRELYKRLLPCVI